MCVQVITSGRARTSRSPTLLRSRDVLQLTDYLDQWFAAHCPPHVFNTLDSVLCNTLESATLVLHKKEESCMKDTDDVTAVAPKTAVTLQSMNVGGWTYTLQYRRCRTKGCRGCPHGPYWFAYRRVGSRVVSKYVGKVWRDISQVDGGDQAEEVVGPKPV